MRTTSIALVVGRWKTVQMVRSSPGARSIGPIESGISSRPARSAPGAAIAMSVAEP